MLETDTEIDGLLTKIGQQSHTAQDLAEHLRAEFNRNAAHVESLELDAGEREERLDLIRANLKTWLRDLLRWDAERMEVVG